MARTEVRGGQILDASVSLTADVTGTLPVGNGGTGAATLTGVLIGNGTAAVTTVTAPSGTIIGTTDTQTLTNKRITQRVSSLSNITSVSVNSDSFDMVVDTGITGAITLNNPTGTPTEGQRLWYALTGTASRAISYDTAFEDSTIVRPTTTSGTNRLDIGFVWNGATSKWRCMAYA